jgi:hypothetical protein
MEAYYYRGQLKSHIKIMFIGCGCGLMWPKKGSRGRVLEEDVDAPHIIGTAEEYSPTIGKANVARFFKPSRINLERSRAPSPESNVNPLVAKRTV